MDNKTIKIIRLATLIPLIVSLVIVLIIQSFPVWILVIMGVSIASYLGVTTYICVKQKNYPLLVKAYVSAIIYIVIFFVIRNINN